MVRPVCAVFLLLVLVFLFPLAPRNAYAIGCITTCILSLDINLPPGIGTVWVLEDGLNLASLPHSFSMMNGTTHTIQVLNLTFKDPLGKDQYVRKQWSFQHIGNLSTVSTTLTTPAMLLNYTNGPTGDFIAEFQKKFLSNLTFVDATGLPITPPSSVTLQKGSSVVSETSYQGVWLDQGVWVVINVTWEGQGNEEAAGLTISGTGGPPTGTIMIKAHQASVHVVDKVNSPVGGAFVTVTLPNSTTCTFFTDAQGNVQLGEISDGAYTAKIVYHGTDLGAWLGDAAKSQILTANLNLSGGSQLPSPATDWWILIAGFILGLLIDAVAWRRHGGNEGIGYSGNGMMSSIIGLQS